MKIIITGRHLDLDDNIRSYAEKKLHKAETFFDRIIEAHMVISAEKHRRIAEVTLHAKRVNFHAQEETEDIYASIDGVMEKVDTQIRRYKEKIKDRKHISRDDMSIIEGVSETSESEALEEEEIPEQANELKIVEANKFAPKPMTPEEAAMQIMISDDDFIMFSNSLTSQVNVIYKRKDGSYGWIEPELK